ncbi:hypothetical protein [Paraburkholderia sp. J8-2]|uniref:hypothetical protein n=1 Tax=Paraburkholderia sp. J8-2 TaxID=2805440 RepID=UPI002AB6DD65|nr:hypothetical protein [Paraburkholderia sp. J8-2]
MKVQLMCLLSSTLLAVSTSALASGPLTPQQCDSFPFVRTHAEVTHEDLMNELGLLKSVGYIQPAGDDVTYPRGIRTAGKRLNAKYLADCEPAQGAVQAPPQVQ